MHPSVRKCYRICLPKEKPFFECPEEDPALSAFIIGLGDTKHQSTSIFQSVNMFRAVLSVFLSALLIQQGAATHTELTAFEDVVSGLLLGQHLNLVFNSEECGVDVGGDFVRAITSIPIKLWRWVELEPGVTRVSFTHTFVAPFSDEYSYDNFQVAIWSNGTVYIEVNEFVPSGNFYGEVSYVCELGAGIRIFNHNYGEAWDVATNYDEVKAALVAGRHVDRAISYERCDGDPIANNSRRITGSNDELSYVMRDGQPFEHIEFVDQEYLKADQMDLFALTTSLYPSGEIVVRSEVWNLDNWDVDMEGLLTCQYDDVMTFTLEPEEDEVEYTSYDEMVEGLLSGHELEVVFDTFDCVKIPGEAPGPHRIYVENIQQWQLAFEDVVSGLLLGQHLNLVFNSEECGVDVGGDFVRAITSIPIKLWRWVELEPGVTRVSFTHTFVAPFSDEYSYDNFQVAIWSNGTVYIEVNEFVPSGNFYGEVSYVCELGAGIRIFNHNYGEAWDVATNYDEVKAALVAGRHVDRAISYERCDGDPIANISRRITGSNDELLYVMRDGQPFEHIEFVDQEYLKADQMDLFALTTSLYPSGEIVVRSEVWNLDNWDVDMEGLLTCQYDDVMTFTLEPEEDEVEYTSYDEMVEGLLSGHELEVVFDTFDCVKIPGEAPGPHRIYVENIQQWQLGATGTGQTFVRFSTYHFRNDADPVLEFEEFDIFSDGNMFMATMQMDLSTGNVNFRDNYLCQLGTDARVFGFLGDTTRITDFSELTEAVEMGYHLTTVIDYNQCNSTIVGDTALYLGMSFYELFETLDTSNATEVLTEHRGMVNLGDSLGVMSIPGTFEEDGTVTWDLQILVPDGQGGLLNLFEGSVVTCDLTGGTAVFKDERSN
ncbi:unnamed protein product [Cyprideis torosa]|uniref:Uncharacterized protein n=1 Tax=Cyprideis torosa TaxID=163714 RepID=A0A7R8WHK4_9CRUS|nr:unnamed protein product [Cyprideis torosa]CAG0899499.1 unnamed protein product [Cyprideis torosa]